MSANKKLSGCEFRKRKKQQELMDKAQASSLLKFLVNDINITTASTTTCSTELINSDLMINCDLVQSGSANVPLYDNIVNLDPNCLTRSVVVGIKNLEQSSVVNDNANCSQHEHGIINQSNLSDFSDPAKWPKLNDKIIQLIVENGPMQVGNIKFPIKNKRKFNPKIYERVMANGETIKRNWLIYSTSTDAVFCFCCKLFASNCINTTLIDLGFSDWNHLARLVQSHENSLKHMKYFKSWKELENKLKSNSTIDSDLQRVMDAEVGHWREVLRRLIIFVEFLGTQSLAFRGKSEVLYDSNNGNFLKLVEFVSKFDPVLSEHLRRINNKETQNKYLSKNIQNELIQLISQSTKDKIVSMILEAKYFSIIVDCTPDQSHEEQLTLIIRFIYQQNNNFEIREHFISFLEANDTKGSGLTETVLSELNEMGLLIENCRGQGYDNGSNMKGKHIGMQNLIRTKEPRAFFVPCMSHTLNLVINDAAQCSRDAVLLFDIVQNIYVFFSSSVKRWSVLKKHISSFTLKPISTTRWESRIDALKPLKEQLGDIHEALVEISLTGDASTINIAESLGKKILEYKFICTLVIWYKLLDTINIVSKYLQNPKMNILTAEKQLESSLKFLQKLRSDEEFEQFLQAAKTIADQLEVPCCFPDTNELRSRRKKSLFGYEGADEVIVEPKQKFKVEFYFKVLDQAISSINERFQQLYEHTTNFNFLYDIQQLSTLSHDDLKTKCFNLKKVLTNGISSDIDDQDLLNELKMISTLIDPHTVPIDVLNYIFTNNLEFAFPNTVISIKILLTIPISVASGERSLSKLKIIKNYLRSTMSQERLNGLAIMSIARDIVEKIDYNRLIEKFAKIKARNINFLQ